MANSDRIIRRGVRVKTTTYVPGMEDELDKVLSSSEVDRLTKKGYIEGVWSGGQSPAPVEVPTPEPTAKGKRRNRNAHPQTRWTS